jgi:prolyl-tRNA synthetase
MRMSHLFSQTLREAPAEAEAPGHQLLLRAGFIRQLAAGVFSYLPLARRALNKIEDVMRQEIEAIGGQEISMPTVHPAEIWKESGRWYEIDDEMGRLKDRSGRELALAMTHEEVVADLVRREIRSYRQLPQLIYQVQTKWRDDPRPRAGLIRAREFTMKDSYSLDADWEGLDRQYRAHFGAYFRIFRRCGLEVIAVKSDTGMMGGKLAHEYMYLNPIGEDTLLLCDQCGYSANRQVARFRKPASPAEPLRPVEKVATPDCKSIEDLANFLNVPKAKTAKAVFLMAEVRPAEAEGQGAALLSSAAALSGAAALTGHGNQRVLVFAVIRGDMEVNETKLVNALGKGGLRLVSLRPAVEDEIRAVGAAPGYASPVGLKREMGLQAGPDSGDPASAGGSRLPKVVVVADDLVPEAPNLAAGANEAGYHLLNVNYGRDFQADLVADIASAQDGDACPQCGSALRAVRGVEVGNIFKLGTRYSEAMGCTFVDAEGAARPVIMGSYGIGSGRLLACVAEAHHDPDGLAWPVTIAPFRVHLTGLTGKGSSQTSEQAEQLYRSLWSEGIDTLYDDRPESPGVKFKDADLIGLPLRLTVSERGLQAGTVELKRRDQAERRPAPIDEVVERVKAELAELEREIQEKVDAPIPSTDFD